MRILHVVPYFYPAWRFGGVPRVVYDLALAQSRAGAHVSIVTSLLEAPGKILEVDAFQDGSSLSTEEYGLRVRHQELDISYIHSEWNRRLSQIGAYAIPGLTAFLLSKIKSLNPDIIHAHEFRTGLTASAAHVSGEVRIPLVISTHGSLFPPTVPPWKTLLKNAFDHTAGQKIINRTCCFHALSKLESDDFHRLADKKNIRINIIPHGFDPNRIQSADSRPRIQSPEPPPQILYVGRISPIKGLPTLLEAWQQISRANPQASLLMLGHAEPDHLHCLRQRFEITDSHEPSWQPGKAVYAGFAAPNIVQERMSQAAVLVVPSYYEVWGAVVLEALSIGCPVVASQACGCLEHLPQSMHVQIVPPNDPAAIINALNTIFQAPPQTAKLPPNLTWDSVAARMAELYRMCIEGETPEPNDSNS